MFFTFRGDELIKQRLAFYQSPVQRSYDEAYSDYDDWIQNASDLQTEAFELFGYETLLFRNPVALRLEYSPDDFRALIHPRAHLHLNDAEGCRIPVSGPVAALSFVKFLVKNFYSEAWARVVPDFPKKATTHFPASIDPAEIPEAHFKCQTVI